LIFIAFIAGLAFLIFSGQQPEQRRISSSRFLVFATATTQLWINGPKLFAKFWLLLVFGTMFVQIAVTKGLLPFATAERLVFLSQKRAC
jgi:hypothetical protein